MGQEVSELVGGRVGQAEEEEEEEGVRMVGNK